MTRAVALWTELRDERRVARTLNLQGEARLRKGQGSEAVTVSEQALGIAERMGDAPAIAAALSHLSSAHWMLGNRRQEREYQVRAVAAVRTLGNDAELALALHNGGVSHQVVGEYQQALEHFREALRIRRRLDDRRGQGSTLNGIAEIYRELDYISQARDFHLEALALRRSVGDRNGVGQSLNNLGLVYRRLADSSKAQQALTEALTLRRETRNRPGEASALLNLAALHYADLQNYDAGLTLLQQALAINEELQALPGLAGVLGHLGRLHFLRGDDDLSRSYYHRAVDLARRVRSWPNLLDSLQYLARAETKTGNLAEALRHQEEALALLESERQRLAGDSFRSSLFANAAGVHADYLDTFMRLHQQEPGARHDRTVFEAVERFKARSLLDQLADAKVNVMAGVSPERAGQLADLQKQLDAAVRREDDLRRAGRVQQLPAATAEVNRLLSELQERRASLRADNPIAAATADPQPLSLPEIQQEVLDDDTVLLAYAVGHDRAYLWVVSPADVHSFDLGARTGIDALARRAHELLTSRNGPQPVKSAEEWRAHISRSDGELARVLASLGERLIGPASHLLAEKRLLIVASDALHYVPFAALPRSKALTPLMVTNEVVMLPSASSVAVLRRNRRARPQPPRTVAVFADPVFHPTDGRVTAPPRQPVPSGPPDEIDVAEAIFKKVARDVRATGGTGELTRLRHSRGEAEAIAALTPAAARMLALDFHATREAVLTPGLRDYRIVHFATHGLVHSEHPELSGLALSMVNSAGEPVDGYLRLHHIYEMRLPADLVVLSACETAVGRVIKGEGVMSLTRGFLHAGAGAVVASLWKVDDRVTADFMAVFYRELLRNRKSPAVALRQAQVALWKDRRFKSPYYWAAFALHGDWR